MGRVSSFRIVLTLCVSAFLVMPSLAQEQKQPGEDTAGSGSEQSSPGERVDPAGSDRVDPSGETSGKQDPGAKVLAGLEEEIRAAETEKDNALAELAAVRRELAQAVRYLEQLREEEGERTARLEELQSRLDSQVGPASSGGVSDEEAHLAERLEKLREEIGPLETELDARRAEVARLATATEERKLMAAEAQAQLDQVNVALDEAAGKLATTEKELASARSQLEQTQSEAADAEAKRVRTHAELEKTRGQLAATEKELAKSQDRLAQTRSELAEAEGQREAAAQRMYELQSRHADEEQVAQRAVEKREQLQSEISALGSELAKLREEEAGLRAVVADLEETSASLRSGLKVDGKQIADLAARRDELLATIRSLEEEVLAAQQAAEGRETQQPQIMQATIGEAAAAAPAGETATRGLPPQQAQAAGPPGRSVALVVAAMRDAPGLSEAGSAELNELEVLLSDGACVTDALRDVFGTINRQTLVSLVQDLGGC